MNTRASLVGGNPTLFTVCRRLIAQSIGVIALVASVLLGLAFELKVIPYIEGGGLYAARIIFYGALGLFITVAVLAQVTVVKRGSFIDYLAAYITVRGNQQFVDRVARRLVKKSLANPEFTPLLDVAYPAIRFLVTRAGFYLPKNFAEVLRESNMTAST